MKITLLKIILFGFIISMLYNCDSTNSNDNDVSETLTGEVLSHSVCKYNKSGETPDTLTCITFSYDGLERKLNINHINTVSNCVVDSFDCNIEISNDTIRISENAIYDFAADCMCLYDVSMVFKGIDPRNYFIEIRDLKFQVDLVNCPDSSYCEVRTYYPYGIDY